MRRLKPLFDNNREWASKKKQQNPHYFQNLAKGQNPKYLWIGCSDSRVPANEIIGLEPGELLVHRNVANLFPHTDLNCLSVLEFGVRMLKVEHVIVCGHYGCSGVQSAMEDHHLGLIDNWLRSIRDTHAQSKQELATCPDAKAKHNRLVELNVLQQVYNVCHTTIVQEAWLGWSLIHILYLVGFRNRITVATQWLFSYFSSKKGARLIYRHLDKE